MAKAKTTTKPAAKKAAKPAAKAAPKATTKTTSKAPAKKTVKPAPKAAPKTTAKAASKPAVKTPAKTAVKPTVKTPAKAAAKPASKAPVKAPAKAAKKAPVKSTSKVVKAPAKTAPKPKAPAKPAAKPAVKAPAKAPAKPAAKPEPKKPAPKPAPKPEPKKPAPKAPAKKLPTFAVNEHVVYPIQGVGEIQAIEKRMFRENEVLYYDIYFETPDMTVMVPVENAESIGLRKIVSSKEALKALELLNKEYEQANTDWKTRNQQNLDLLKKGTISDIAQVVKTLYDRSTSKELPIQERKLFDNASKLLIDEISLALKKSKKESETMIFEKLEGGRKPVPEPAPEELDFDKDLDSDLE